MLKINYIAGDASRPTGTGVKIIAHICNDAGYWGKGFVMALSQRWPEAKRLYHSWFEQGAPNFALGAVSFVPVEEDVIVANMIGQHGIRNEGGLPPIRYDAVESALRMVSMKARMVKASVHMPRIGTGLAGGDWGRIEPILIRTLISDRVPVTVYNFDALN